MTVMPERSRTPLGIAALVTAIAVFVPTFHARLLPLHPFHRVYWDRVSHLQRHLTPEDTVWLGVLVHPIGARDAHYYWFGFAEHIRYMLDAQARGDAPRYLPAVKESDLPPCRAARREDRRVRLLMAGSDIETLPGATQCVAAMLGSGRAHLALPLRNVVEVRR
jgi:hypothetical protein